MTWKNGKAPFFAVHWKPSVRTQSKFYDDFQQAYDHWLRLHKRRLKHLEMCEVERHGKEGWTIRRIHYPIAYRTLHKGLSLDDGCHAREQRRKSG